MPWNGLRINVYKDNKGWRSNLNLGSIVELQSLSSDGKGILSFYLFKEGVYL